jgi:predicted SAM-dependent methyltransferase
MPAHVADSSVRSLTSRLLGWARRGDGASGAARETGPPVGTKVLAKLLAALAHRDAPVVLDLGPVVGSNVSFLGEQLGCKLRVEDLYADLDRLTREQRLDTLPEFLRQRFRYEPESVDAVLCWDVLDYMDKTAATVISEQAVRWVKPGGVVLCFFSTVATPTPVYTRYAIADTDHLVYRTAPAVHGKRTVYQNRDIERLFAGLKVTESFLLRNKTREVLLRKKAPFVPQG